jgi:chemotaxis methyl-accepting protein methylase/signal transduction histidine kinase/chemotaxis response regulator CheB
MSKFSAGAPQPQHCPSEQAPLSKAFLASFSKNSHRSKRTESRQSGDRHMATASTQGKPKRSQRTKKGNGLFVVGIGASAGGLEALKLMLPNLPVNGSMAYIIIQHLDPHRRSMMTALLEPHTKMKVMEITDGQVISPDTVYMATPGKNVKVTKGKLVLTNPSAAVGPRPSIDYFLTSLSEEKKDKAVGIILSGTGTDGTHGILAIKANGGLTIAQKENTARYDGMPRSAIETGHVDLILPPEKIGNELQVVLKYPRLVPLPLTPEKTPLGVNLILKLLSIRSGTDLSDYKLSTINRRIGRRMALHDISAVDDYARFVEKNPEELDLLFKDILISVTSFFRDKEAFKSLERLLEKALSEKADGEVFRAWVVGCSTGEEAYSVAIMLTEKLAKLNKKISLQIFATDLDAEAIEKARRGIYPVTSVLDMDAQLLKKYFSHEDSVVKVSKPIRELVVFARQDITRNPPFMHLDLISCRNLLIYFNNRLQERIFSLFHFSLNPGGLLFLGKSESASQYPDLFDALDARYKVFTRKKSLRVQTPTFAFPNLPATMAKTKERQAQEEINIDHIFSRSLIAAQGIAAILIDERQDIVYSQGDLNPFISFPSGEIGSSLKNIYDLLKPSLKMSLRTLVHKARQDKKPTNSGRIRFPINNVEEAVTIIAAPAIVDHGPADLVLVVFERTDMPEFLELAREVGETDDPRFLELAQELAVTKEHLRTTVEELETSNEELQSLNEELQSANEELQSSNEELETSNEELHSTNEELITVNEALQTKSEELLATNAELERSEHNYRSLIETMNEGLLLAEFIQDKEDKPVDMVVQRVNPGLEHLLDTSVDKIKEQRLSVSLGPDWIDPAFLQSVCDAYQSGEPVQFEYYFPSLAKHFLFSVFTPEPGLVGMIVTDITAQKLEEKTRQEHLATLQTLIKVTSAVLAETTLDGLLQKVVEAACEVTGARLGTAGHGYKEGIFQVGATARSQELSPCPPGENFHIEKGGVYIEIIEQRGSLRLTDEELRHHPRWWGLPEGHASLKGLLGATLQGAYGSPEGLIMVTDKVEGEFTEEDETALLQLASLTSLGLQHVKSCTLAQQRADELQAVMDATPAAVWIAHDQKCRNITGNRFSYDILRLPPGANPSKSASEGELPTNFRLLRAGQEISPDQLPMQLAASQGISSEGNELTVMFDDGSRRDIFGNAAPLFDEHGEVRGAVGTFVDITNMKRAEEELRKSRDLCERQVQDRTSELAQALRDLQGNSERLEKSNRELKNFASLAAHDLQEPLRKIQSFSDRLISKYPALDEIGRDYLQRMQSAAKRMQDLIVAILTLSRVTKEGQPFNTVDLHKAAQEALGNLETALQSNGGQVEVETLPTVEAYYEQMVQLFQNLIGNAIKFHGEEPPLIKVSARPIPTPPRTKKKGSWVEIVVQDNGIGFDAKYLDRIFAPFQRLHGRDQYEGQGVGLAICRNIVERHGGRILADGQPGQGSTFRVQLPIKQHEE